MERPRYTPENHPTEKPTEESKEELWNPYMYPDRRERAAILAARVAKKEEELKQKRDEETAEITRRGFLKLGAGAAGTVVAVGVGGALLEAGRDIYYDYEREQQEKEMKEYLRKYEEWKVVQARVDEINEERRRLRRLGPQGASRRQAIGRVLRIPGTRTSTSAPAEVREAVENMIKTPGAVLSKETQMIAETAADSRTLRALLELPADAAREDVIDTMMAQLQTYMEHFSDARDRAQFGNVHPGDPRFPEMVERAFPLFIRYRDIIEPLVVQYSKQYNVPARLIYGIMFREAPTREQGFAPNDYKATGLMQITPDTARDTAEFARRQGGNLSITGNDGAIIQQLLDIPTSVHVGIANMARLYYSGGKGFGQWGLVASAYNAGAGNLDTKIELLRETRKDLNMELMVGTHYRRLVDLGVTPVTFRNVGIKRNVPNLRMEYPFEVEYLGSVAHQYLKTKED